MLPNEHLQRLTDRLVENANAVRDDVNAAETPNHAYLEQIIRDAQELLS